MLIQWGYKAIVRTRMNFKEQPRTFLLLEDSSPTLDMVKKILESPLGLAQEIVCKLFNNDFGALRDDMDVIKEFEAGVTQAKSLSSYSVANYYSLMFSFHQWFHTLIEPDRAKFSRQFSDKFSNPIPTSN